MDYNMETSQYRVAKAERLYNAPYQEKYAHDGHLLFLFWKEEQGYHLWYSNKPEYKAWVVPYYMDSDHYYEAEWVAKESKLRMEFYIDLIWSYCNKGDSTLGIFSSLKFIVAYLVRIYPTFFV